MKNKINKEKAESLFYCSLAQNSKSNSVIAVYQNVALFTEIS